MYDFLGHVWLEQFREDLNGLGMLVVTDLGDEITFVCSPSWLHRTNKWLLVSGADFGLDGLLDQFVQLHGLDEFQLLWQQYVKQRWELGLIG